mmetsp:Transcript_10678/g.26149  ORF Transcript_10678/g.26149 Transcript_10678/m.26149 type:complete len:204 (+) Transcript_10678:927-1538(+)
MDLRFSWWSSMCDCRISSCSERSFCSSSAAKFSLCPRCASLMRPSSNLCVSMYSCSTRMCSAFSSASFTSLLLLAAPPASSSARSTASRLCLRLRNSFHSVKQFFNWILFVDWNQLWQRFCICPIALKRMRMFSACRFSIAEITWVMSVCTRRRRSDGIWSARWFACSKWSRSCFPGVKGALEEAPPVGDFPRAAGLKDIFAC